MRQPWYALAVALVATSACEESGPTVPEQPRASRTAAASVVPDARYFIAREDKVRSASSLRLFAEHPEMGLTSEFLRGRVLLRTAPLHPTDSGLNLRADAWGCVNRMAPLEEADPAQSDSEPHSASYAQPDGSFVEWYRHGPRGLEQGFTVSKLPTCIDGDHRLLIRIPPSPGWTSAVTADGSRAAFRHPSGPIVHYTDPHANGADGRAHPIRIVMREGAIALEVDTTGAVLPLVIDPLAWTEQQKLTASDGAANDYFGYAVSLKGSLLAVGAYRDDSETGSVYAYTRSGATWGSQQKIVPSDAATGDRFGYSVSNSGTYLAVGASNDDDGGSDAGSAYVFTRGASNWGTQKKIVAADAAADDGFGCSVAIDGTTLLIGAQGDDDLGAGAGAAYVYTLIGSNWTFQQKLVAADADADAGDAFGYAVALSGNTAVIASPFDSQGASIAGAGFIFVRSGTTWTQQAKLIAADAASDHTAGSSVSISGNDVVIGASGDSDKASFAGAAYIWTRSGTTWTPQQKLFASTAGVDHSFGRATAISGDNLVVGAKGYGSLAGAAYVFQRSGTTWTEITRLLASDSAAGANYGESVSLDGTAVAAGAHLGNATRGAAYVASLADNSPCASDADCKSAHCVEGVCCNTACAGTCTSCLASRKASGADGVCGNVKADADPRSHCTDALPASGCGMTGVCNGSGACSLYSAGTECAAAVCASATSANPKDSCNGSGSCIATAAVACQRGYLCDDAVGACRTSCTQKSDCDPNADADFDCIDEVCQVANTGKCHQDTDCQSGACADGICCNEACSGPCVACTAALKGSGEDGVCGNISADTDPRDQCSDGPEECDNDGMCDGQGTCRSLAKPTQPCGETTCNGNIVQGQLCDGEGHCADNSIDCAPYPCSGMQCATACIADDDCADATTEYVGAFCNGAGKCQDKSPDGTSCAEARECASSFCADGVCCNKACTGQCEACGEAGAEGKCVAVQGAPRGPRPACDEAPAGEPCQEVSCDGTEPSSCQGFVAAVKCQDPACQNGRATGQGLCDGAGTCQVPDPTDCGAYTCGATACLTECARNQDCAGGNQCVAGECLSGARCSEDGTGLIDLDGNESTCAPYLCEGEACLISCTASTDCADGFVCNPEGQKCEAKPAASSNDDAGCGCRVPSRSSPRGPGPGLWLGLMLAILTRRRAQRARWLG